MFKRLMLISASVAFLASCGPETRLWSSEATPSAVIANETLRLIQTIPLPNVEGRIDHLSVDVQGQRLFVAALGNNTVEILGLGAGNVLHSISGLNEPQGVVFVPEVNKIFVSDAGDGLCKIFDGNTFALLDQLNLSGDADNLRYDRASKLVYAGYGEGGLSLIDAFTDKVNGDIKLNGHPESFQLDSPDSRIFINVPSTNQIAVVDSQKQKVIAIWELTNAIANYPMALDETHHRLFVGFRLPARLAIYDSQTGKWIAGLDSTGDVDDIFYDSALKLIFVIGGEGFIDVFSQMDADHYQRMMHIPTASGARTGLWVPEWKRLFVAVPQHEKQEAEIQVYGLQP